MVAVLGREHDGVQDDGWHLLGAVVKFGRDCAVEGGLADLRAES
jgi:hypothetical protein